MKEINITFKNENEKLDFVLKSESLFENRLDSASKEVVESDVSCVLLSGPTCAGKTTTAQKLISDFNKIGKNVTVISLDDFFKDRIEQREVQHGKKIDYDSVDVLDLEELERCIKSATVGNIIKVPKFDFLTQSRQGYTEHYISENEVLMFEGIQAVYPEITRLFKTNFKGIFIDVQNDVTINGTEFKKQEIRLVRRLVRDRKFRGASADFTFFLWETVRDNEKKSIYPNKDVCKVQVDSFIEHEMFLMKDFVAEVLSEIKQDSKYYTKAQKLLSKFDNLQSISYDYIPKNSLYTEFLGKK
ncbi:MAG: hypothetical protein IJD89_04105 [Clostridia bacterium]|nr:hypothetical protein [Clostridia bacterium]MBR2943474.1 hypothetical protein [Clostridia bacterium]